MNRLFGTDGIRGHVSSDYLSPESMAKLGRGLGSLIKLSGLGTSIAIGRDTRASGIVLEHALVSGIIACGVDCELLGVLPTAAVALYTRQSASGLGLMISASHNPYHDNGIKLFDSWGFKINEATEQWIEDYYFNHPSPAMSLQPGKVIRHSQAYSDYCVNLKSLLNTKYPRRLSIVIDCAHGAASMLENFLTDMGHDIEVIGASPDGSNINRGYGSEHPQTLQNAVKNRKADVGIAFDGDADRVLFVDEEGAIIDGDAILCIMALALKNSGALLKETLVTTVMSSVALDNTLNPAGIKIVRTAVGDKHVAHAMAHSGYSFGGENSGHIIKFPETTTGDGIFSALKFIEILCDSNRSAKELASVYQPTPKLLTNILVAEKIPLALLKKTSALIEKTNESLSALGRVMARYSGTENKLRILVEAQSYEECQKIAQDITHSFEEEAKSTGGQNMTPATAKKNSTHADQI